MTIEEPMFAGVRFDVFKKAIDNGFYYIGSDNKIHCSTNAWLFVGNSFSGHFIKTRNTNGYNEHSFDWDKDEHVKVSDYGKTWTLTKEELKEIKGA